MNNFTKVTYKVHSSKYSIGKALDNLSKYELLAYDCETQSRYSVEERKEAKDLIKTSIEVLSRDDIHLSKLVAKSSGLSNPRIVKITHFIFGISNDESIILVAYDYATELLVCNWICDYKGKLIIHNSVFDISLVYNRTGRFPIDMEDTQLRTKCLINHVNTWEARTGLKHLMGSYYDPRWTQLDDGGYDNEDYLNKAFLRYCAIDGAATYRLWEDLQKYAKDNKC